MAAAFSGCGSKEAEKIQPNYQGKRGESCQARNDCAGGLACVNNLCIKDDFAIAPLAKQCVRVECATTADCCGDKPTEAPAKCAARATKCTPTLPGCTTGASCGSPADCGGGACIGSCSNSFANCTNSSQCTAACQYTGLGSTGYQCASDDSECTTTADCPAVGTCQFMQCSCANPEYDFSDPICSDTDCDDLCTLTCQDELCVQDESCENDTECAFNYPNTMCHQGRCVECAMDSDCDTDDGEQCREGACQKPCEANEGCPLFHSCQEGACVETGCTSDRECVLAAGSIGYGQDARLAVCAPSDSDPNVKQCKIPCESDTTCGQFSVCENNFCKFVGCDSNEECRGFLGLANQQLTDERPYYSKAECRAPVAP
jgi:hypothetical protein